MMFEVLCMKFAVEGTFKNGSKDRAFLKEIEATSEERARELTFSQLGANHAIGRSRIKIKSVRRFEHAVK